MKGKWFHVGSVLLIAATLTVWSAPAGAVTFNFSTLNWSSTAGAKDPVSGTTIFNKSDAEQNPWVEGTDGGAAAIDFQLNTQGNNSSKIYVPSGGPGFSLPGTNGVPALSGSETTIGTSNTQYTGAFAQANGMPFYFAFTTLTSTGFTPTLTSATLNSLYISGASTNLEIIGLNGAANAGGTVIDSQLVPANSGIQQVILNWTGVTEVYILSATADSGALFGYDPANFFYVNDIEVNDAVPAVPLPPTALLLGSGLLGMVGLGWRSKKFKA